MAENYKIDDEKLEKVTGGFEDPIIDPAYWPADDPKPGYNPPTEIPTSTETGFLVNPYDSCHRPFGGLYWRPTDNVCSAEDHLCINCYYCKKISGQYYCVCTKK